MNKKEFLRAIFDKYELIAQDDIFKLHDTAIITKTGIQKICAAEKFKYEFDVVVCQPEYCAVRCDVMSFDGKPLSTSFGSAEASNVKNKQRYYLEMAEKRAKARAVLIAIGAHGYLYSEDEADDFKQAGNG